MNNERLGGLELEDNVETVFKVILPLKESNTGFGYQGVLLRDKNTDKMQCHICGEWISSLCNHLVKHDITSNEYRDEFELPKGFPLCSRSRSKKMSDSASREERLLFLSKIRNIKKAEKHLRKKGWRKRLSMSKMVLARENMVGLCPDQINARFYALAEKIGKTPSFRDILKHDQSLYAGIRRRFNNKFNKFKKSIGLNTTKKPDVMSDSELLGILHSFYHKKHRTPMAKDFINGNPCSQTYRNRFGSWNRALMMAGYSTGESYK